MTHPTDHPVSDAASAAPGRRVHAEAVWDQARDAYLAGEAGASVAARLGIARSVFWDHAAAQGWRRRDRPTEPPPPFDPDRPILDDDAQIALIDRRIAWALEAGADTAALRWMRMRDRIEDRQARRDDAEERARHAAGRRSLDVAREVERIARAGLANVETEVRLQRLRTLRHDRPTARAPDSPDSKISTAPASSGLDPDAPNLSRAERRRRLKYAARHGKPPPD